MLSSPATGRAALGTAGVAGVPAEASASLVVASVFRAAAVTRVVVTQVAAVTPAEVAVILAGAAEVIPEAVVAEASP
jgi:hypothetical protein